MKTRSRRNTEGEVPRKKAKKSAGEDVSHVMSGAEAQLAGNQQLNRDRKKQMKAAKKKRKRAGEAFNFACINSKYKFSSCCSYLFNSNHKFNGCCSYQFFACLLDGM